MPEWKILSGIAHKATYALCEGALHILLFVLNQLLLPSLDDLHSSHYDGENILSSTIVVGIHPYLCLFIPIIAIPLERQIRATSQNPQKQFEMVATLRKCRSIMSPAACTQPSVCCVSRETCLFINFHRTMVGNFYNACTHSRERSLKLCSYQLISQMLNSVETVGAEAENTGQL